uniref:Uncharacterized protein n=1 Tax=Anguilla anguilla TaxID=7936 RepID=A0A0E9TI13_ANGAN
MKILAEVHAINLSCNLALGCLFYVGLIPKMAHFNRMEWQALNVFHRSQQISTVRTCCQSVLSVVMCNSIEASCWSVISWSNG